MDRPYIEWLRVEDFRCIRKVDVHLTPLHAFIGPNDSGKSSLLRAIASGGSVAWLSGSGVGVDRRTGRAKSPYPGEGYLVVGTENAASDIHKSIHPCALIRFDPDELRAPVPLIEQNASLWFQNERGRGLAALYDALQSRDVDSFLRIRDRFIALFPTAKTLRLENPTSSSKSIGLTLLDGKQISAGEMSEGMLYWLAFAIIESLAPHSMLFIEEPENGLHPSRIREVMTVLREMSARMQILIATHSPLVINELQPDEVTIVTRTPEAGTICTPIAKTKNFAERSKVYALGELWLSYADGELEKELVSGDAESAKAS